jgi:hypothetical protein
MLTIFSIDEEDLNGISSWLAVETNSDDANANVTEADDVC